jgi:hypothetical protein
MPEFTVVLEGGRALTYTEWLQCRIAMLYSERLALRRAAGPRHSEKRRAQWRAYKNTAKGRVSRARYEDSPRGQETRAAYEHSGPGIMARFKARMNARRSQLARRIEALRQQVEADGLGDLFTRLFDVVHAR